MLELRCGSQFVAETVSREDSLATVTRKASAKLGRPIKVTVVDQSASGKSGKMEQLMNFGRAHQDIVKIRE